jgi:glucan phosphoethanolaminetransferase (alkaline phosphatase superfamily)
LVNSYDNAILHTDYFLDQVMQRLEERKALVMYVSDHGEGLGEDGMYSHHFGSTRRVERHVPWIVWASKAFVAEHPERIAALEAQRSVALRHDHLFHSILDCAGIASAVVDPRLSVCRPRAAPQAKVTAADLN